MYSELLLTHFRDPQNVGELESPAESAECVNPACGDTLRLFVRWDIGATESEDRVAEARYRVRGCTAAIASGSALTGWLRGRTRAEVAAVTPEEIEAAVGGLTPESRHAAWLCRDVARKVASGR